jgi:hypothetical protein
MVAGELVRTTWSSEAALVHDASSAQDTTAATAATRVRVLPNRICFPPQGRPPVIGMT